MTLEMKTTKQIYVDAQATKIFLDDYEQEYEVHYLDEAKATKKWVSAESLKKWLLDTQEYKTRQDLLELLEARE